MSSGMYSKACTTDSACVVGRCFLKRIVEQQGGFTSGLLLASVNNNCM
jgi:hypothetical protein